MELPVAWNGSAMSRPLVIRFKYFMDLPVAWKGSARSRPLVMPIET